MIDFSTLKELYVDGKKVTSLFLDGHEVPVGEPEVGWIRFTTLESGMVGYPFTVALSGSSAAKMDLLSSYDGRNWGSYTNNTWISAQSTDAGQTVYFKAASKNERATTRDNVQWHFVTQSAAFKLDGDLKYLLDPTGEETSCMQYGFRGLFENNNQVHDVSGLSITLPHLGQDSCKRLFSSCRYLSAGNMYIEPQLPVNGSIPTGVFSEVFNSCTSLTSTPELLSLSASNYFYNGMFQGCTALSAGSYMRAKELVNGNSVNFRYMFRSCSRLSRLSVDLTSFSGADYWMNGVSNTIDGVLVCPKALGTDATIRRGVSECPTNWRVANYNVNGYDMQNAFIRGIQTTAFLEDGSPHAPDTAALSVFNGQTAERLYDMTQYVVQLPADTTTAGTKTVQFNGIGSYSGTKELSYRIIAKNLSNCTATVSSVYDNDEVSYIEVVQPDTGYTLVEGTDYTVAVSTAGGQSTVTITGIGSWSGTYTTTVAHKTSGTSPVAIYKHSPESQNSVYVRLQSNGGPINTVAIDKKPMSDQNASWTKLDTSYASDNVGFWIRARDKNQTLATSDNNYLWIDCGYDQSNAATVDISGDIVSLIDRSQTQTAISTSNTFNSTFQNNDKILDASKLSCSAKTMTATDRPMRRLFASRGSGYGALGGNQQILTAIPEFEGLSVTTNGSYGYLANFQRCTALTSVAMQIPWPIDSAFRNDIANQQFVDCTGLVSAVVKSHFGDGKACPDSYLAGVKMLDNAFSHCTSLSCISTDLTAWPGRGFTNWLADVAAAGTFICPTALGTDATIQRGESYCPTGWTVVNYDAKPMPLKFTAEQANSTVALSAFGNAPAVSLLSSTDGETWASYTVNGIVTLANVGDYVMFKADQPNSRFASSDSANNRFVMTGKIAASGNIMSLLDGENKIDTVSSERCFQSLFATCSQLTQAPELPAETLADYCYSYMFYGCSQLSTAPALPAETLARDCYASMFNYCTSLSSAPELPAKTLAQNCYKNMFYSCTSLSSAPELLAETLASGCYQNMFYSCTSLSSAPELLAIELCSNCYNGMFGGCTSLSSASLPVDNPSAADAMSYMFSDCTSLTSLRMNNLKTLATAQTMMYMLQNCTSLTSITTNLSSWNSNATGNWLHGASNTGTFTLADQTCVPSRDESGVPAGWTVEENNVKYVDYVQTNGYVLDTLYKPTVNTSLSTCLSGSVNGNCFIGFKYVSDQQDYRLFDLGDTLYFDMGGGSNYGGRISNYGGRIQASGWDTSKWTDISAWNFGVKFTPEGGSEQSAVGATHSTADWDANGTINIAGFTASTGQSDICIRGLKIYENGVLVRDFKAAVDENDVAGLYDEVEEVFYYPTDGYWTAHTDGDDIDTDGDGYSDVEEKAAGSDSEDPASIPDDIDGDGWSNDDESMHGTDPTDPNDNPDTRDSDSDGWTDGEEIKYGTDPNDQSSNPDNQDSDADGISDGDEIRLYNTDPLNSDTDGDGYSDADEINNNTDPNNPDDYPGSEGGGDEEDPYNVDSDNDGYSDGDEQDAGTDPDDPDSHP